MAFSWIPYYKELAQKIVQFRDKREELLNIIRGIDREYIDFLQKDNDGTKISDIHPFAIYSIFNRLFLVPKKQKILEYLKTKFNLTSPIPNDFDGIPSVNPQNSFWGMPWNDSAKKEIEENWDLFCCANEEIFDEKKFCQCFDKVISQQGAKWNVTQALFRMNPERFISLDSNSREYLKEQKLPVFQEKELFGNNYLTYISKVKSKIENEILKEKTFYQISYKAWVYGQKHKKVWLLSWNPDKWNWTNYEDWSDKTKNGMRFYEDWRCSNSHAKNGEEFFLIRTGVEPKGICAHGYLTSDSFLDEEKTRRVGVEFDYILNSEKEKLLSIDILNQQCPNQEWNPQSSGIEIKDENISKLHALWNNLKFGGNMANNNYVDLLISNKNIILHGAPGTGKTYTAKDIASQIICGKPFSEIEKDSDEEKAFNEQTEFVQFHPSYDYSDFVEGLRPVEGEANGEVGFERKDGVFKEFCERALKSTTSGGNDNFEDAWKRFVIELNESNSITIETKLKRKFTVELNQNGDGLIDKQENYTRFYNYSQLYNVYRNLPGVPNGGHDNYRQAIINYMKGHNGLDDYEPGQESTTEKKYIFIIDEINRGEMSKIFGELFFSIDPDYRGTKGKVRTQYSNMVKTKNSFDYRLNSISYGNFFVPENVYIIGTMNDIDRSVESMDFAMRRRFTFVELFADKCLGMLKNISCSDGLITVDEIKTKMEALNSKIEREPGLSSAYHIGGSYFAKLQKYEGKTKTEAFEALWNNHLKPLITDYLRGTPGLDKKLENYRSDYLNAGINNSEDSEGTNA